MHIRIYQTDKLNSSAKACTVK